MISAPSHQQPLNGSDTDKMLSSMLDQLQLEEKFAVGNDLVFVPRFRSLFSEPFKSRIYCPAEMAYCESFADSILRYASTWAAKEAVYKAFKQLEPTAIIGWKNIEIIRKKAAGRPEVIIQYPSRDLDISLSITHDQDYAWALAFLKQC